jgi:hypothetical protein
VQHRKYKRTFFTKAKHFNIFKTMVFEKPQYFGKKQWLPNRAEIIITNLHDIGWILEVEYHLGCGT